jgi:ribosomal protein S18 acetylase RimI-like enzyme
VTDFTALDNPVWTSLQTAHRALGRSNGLACRYRSEVSPFAALQTPTAAAFADLSALVDPEQGVGLCTADPVDVPAEWLAVKAMVIEQMVLTRLELAAGPIPLSLGEADVPEMLALTAATGPGPFLPATIRMGNYFGVRTGDGRLISMAGERLKPEGFTEISAVCTDPEFRGRGHAQALVCFLAARILAEGRVPILHVALDNKAKTLYHKIGFRLRREVHISVVVRR